MVKDNFWNLTGFHRWVRSPSGKSFRTVNVKEGMFILIHRNTGNFIVGTSKEVSIEVDKQIALLDSNKHKIKSFNKLLEFDNQLEILEFHTKPKQVKVNLNLLEHMINSRGYNYLWRKK